MKVLCAKYVYIIVAMMACYGCMVTSSSDTYKEILSTKYSPAELGKAKFLHGDMGGIYPANLETNAFAYKIALIALKANDSTRSGQSLFTPYGFQFPKKIWNWKNSPAPSSEKATGLIFGNLSGRLPLDGEFTIEVADFGCGACHGGPLYDKNGLVTDQFVMGMPNTSIDLQRFADDLFNGYKIIYKWSDQKMERKIHESFPFLSREELNGLRLIFKGLRKEVPKIVSTRGNVAPYKIGGAGTSNGVGAIKFGLHLLNNSVYDKNQASRISIPSYADRSFRSSFLVAGTYAPEGKQFFYEITTKDTTSAHDQAMASIIGLFTIGTMGNNAKTAVEAIPDAKDIMRFISTFEPPAFPGAIDSVAADRGRIFYQDRCQYCHGKYEGTSIRNRLVSFPNKLIPLASIKTDSLRAVAITPEDLKVLEKLKLRRFFDAQLTKGYVAPILTGVWATAPYLHNGSVPTLWHLMHPEARPEKFFVGGHALDYEKMGIKGELKENVYQYPEDYRNWSAYEVYDTREIGMSNSGHADQFNNLSESDKQCLIEFMKTL